MQGVDHTFVNFLKTGQLGELELGMSLHQVLDYLGPPDGYKSIKAYNRKLPKIKQRNHELGIYGDWFGALEVIFDLSDSLISIKLRFDVHTPSTLPQPINEHNWYQQGKRHDQSAVQEIG